MEENENILRDELQSLRQKKLESKRTLVLDIKAFRFVVSPVIYEEKSINDDDKIIRKKRAIIELKHLKSELVMVHRFTNFIFLWKNYSYNTMINKAYTICRFLNFIIENNHMYELTSFSDLNIEHGVDYLKNLALNGGSISYFFSERNTLDKFYLYLSKKELLNHISKDKFKSSSNKKSNRKRKRKSRILEIEKTLFQDATYPSNVNNDILLHHLREEFIVPFIEVAIEISPRIALGIFFQIRGGLRASEVVNIKITGVSFDEWGIKGAIVSLHEEIISNTYKHTYQACIKKKRNQEILNLGGYLPKLLKMHYVEKEYFSKDNSNALFSNGKGELLSPQMYNYYFNKVRVSFIKKLLNSPNKEIRHYGMFLRLSKWSTHIGRGIASNFIADSTGNEYQLARFRGDTNLSSAIPYIEDSSKYKESIYISGSKMYEEGMKMMDTCLKDNDIADVENG